LNGGQVAMDGAAKDVCEAYHASVYGATQAPRVGTAAVSSRAIAVVDGAGEEDAADDAGLDASQIRVFAFDPDRAGFGDGRAVVRAARWEDPDGRVLRHVSGGEIVRLVVEAEALGLIESAIIGFLLKDRLGQHLFGKNTWREDAAPQSVAAGGRLRAVFEFRMPYLCRGSYSVDIAVADGSHLAHVQTAWRYDALALESVSSTMSTGLVGIPFRSISLRSDN